MKLPFFKLVINFTVYSVLITYLAAIFGSSYVLEKRQGKESFTSKLPYVIGFGIPILFSVFFGGRTVSIYIPPLAGKVAAVVMLFGVALVMFYIKINALIYYSIAELLFALLVLAQTVGGITTDDIDLERAVGLMAGIYLAIRGLDNLRKARDEKRRQTGDAT